MYNIYNKLKLKNSIVGDTVKAVYDKSKKVSNPEDVLVLENEFTEFGVLSLPYIMEQFGNNNLDMMQFLPEITYKYLHIPKEELKSKDAEYWKDFFREHKENIKSLKNLF